LTRNFEFDSGRMNSNHLVQFTFIEVFAGKTQHLIYPTSL